MQEMIDRPNLKIEIIEPIFSTMPEYQSEHASGFDLHPRTTGTIKPHCSQMVPTGLKMAIPVGYEGQIRPRSGLSLKHSVTVLNSPGTIDSDYRGEIKILLINHGNKEFKFTPQDRVAQMVIVPVVRVNIVQCDALNNTKRGEGGFGSTG